jgi:hypothetical protein
MVGHHAPGVHEPACFRARFAKTIHECCLRPVLRKDVCPIVATADDVIDRARVFQPQFPSHAPILCPPHRRFNDKMQSLTPLGFFIAEKLFADALADLPRTPPKTRLGQALGYLLGQKPSLLRCLTEPRAEIENNLVERVIPSSGLPALLRDGDNSESRRRQVDVVGRPGGISAAATRGYSAPIGFPLNSCAISLGMAFRKYVDARSGGMSGRGRCKIPSLLSASRSASEPTWQSLRVHLSAICWGDTVLS